MNDAARTGQRTSTTDPSQKEPSGFGLIGPGQAAERLGVSIDTLRYYEREGLIGPVARTVGGRRLYSEEDLFFIGLISCLREAGLGIADLREFTRLLRSPHPPEDRAAFLSQRRTELEQKVTSIQAAIAVLSEKIEYYSRLGHAAERGDGDRKPR